MILQLERRLVSFRTKDLIGTGILLERVGGGGVNLAKMAVSVLHKELECKVEKRKYKKLEGTQPRIKNINH